MTKRSFGWCLALLLLGASVMAQANCFWQVGDPFKMHYPQLPDTLGWDVNATYPIILADDWQCSETGYIKDIHWWGSWRNGVQDVINSFIIKIYEDIPADPAAGIYSHPGALLWEREIPGFDGISFTSESFEGWFDPTNNEVLNNNHQQYFFYNYCLDQTDWFPQEQGTVYWLSISAITASPNNAKWGWKSTLDHFNDDAVWALVTDENWTELYEPGSGSAGPRTNDFSITVDPSGLTTSGTGTDFYGDGWYDYPSGWKNIWFYDHPFDPDRYKVAHIEFDASIVDPGLPPTLEVAINWSTDAWSIDQPPSDSAPPLPGEDEALYIGRQVLLSETTFGGHYSFDITLPDYNPEWVSIDVRGRNFDIQNGVIVHDCMGDPVSLDLAFVVTGDPNTPPTGACCFQDGTCSVVPEIDCAATGGSYQGDGTACQGDISPANGIDDACEDPPFGACCLPDGSCFVFNPTDCANKGGTYNGDGTSCAGDVSPANGIDDACEDPPFGACCLQDGTCLVFMESDCIKHGGTYQGDGTACLGDLDGDGIDDACEPQEGACCTQDGACAIMFENDCLAIGGTWHGAGSTCLGDNNGNGMDDACETWHPGDPQKMHYPQLPDTLGWDVNATFPEVLADDWQCSETGWVKDIHFWGSWLNGLPGQIAAFTISIHEDIPAGTDGIPYSRPGKLLWEYTISDFNTTPLTHESFEGFYDPSTQVFLPDNHQRYYQYDVYLSKDKWFWQNQGTIYWLNISAIPQDQTAPERWGWKSSIEHFNDDAAWGLTAVDVCPAPNNGDGTIDFPAPCPFFPADSPMVISNGLPAGTTIEVRPTFDNFTNVVVKDGTQPGEKIVSFTAQTNLAMQGTGGLATFNRIIPTTTDFVVRVSDYPPDPVHQDIPTEILSMSLTGGGISGDPDFDMLQITAGSDNGLPSPGHTTLTRLPSGDWRVDSFFDITYRIEFSGAPGSALEGFGGTTQGGPVRINQGGADVDLWVDLHEPPLFEVSMDLSFVITGDPSPCDCSPGDANNDGTVNLIDILYVISYIYGSPAGPPPVPYRICSGDVNCDCQVDLIDILYMIANLYNSPPGPAPCSCDRWLGACGGPLRK